MDHGSVAIVKDHHVVARGRVVGRLIGRNSQIKPLGGVFVAVIGMVHNADIKKSGLVFTPLYRHQITSGRAHVVTSELVLRQRLAYRTGDGLAHRVHDHRLIAVGHHGQSNVLSFYFSKRLRGIRSVTSIIIRTGKSEPRQA